MAGLIKAWVHGWALSRGVGVPVAEPDGYRLDVGRPGHRVRYVLADAGSVARRARALTEPGTWLKVSGSREEVAETVPSNWTVGPPEYLMSTPLAMRPVMAAPEPYRAELVGDGVVTDVVVRAPDGSRAATGRVAIAGGTAVVDQVVTEPEHQRRGLGRFVMRRLDEVAVAAGADKAVLVATEEGRALYLSLGWTVAAEITPAHLPEPEKDITVS
ncbi:GNAT family N-acetyltransferase [Amycolatopsis sp. cmx-11-51]|uniref:GNAT family N-acetyltransferase n=1 Tax=unclassified Amycolatopsis TaxID=2618356 RepID=UPI0039E2840E